MYKDNHMLAKDVTEIDFVINAALWLLEHTSDTPRKDPKPPVLVEEIPKEGSKPAEK